MDLVDLEYIYYFYYVTSYDSQGQHYNHSIWYVQPMAGVR